MLVYKLVSSYSAYNAHRSSKVKKYGHPIHSFVIAALKSRVSERNIRIQYMLKFFYCYCTYLLIRINGLTAIFAVL